MGAGKFWVFVQGYVHNLQGGAFIASSSGFTMGAKTRVVVRL